VSGQQRISRRDLLRGGFLRPLLDKTGQRFDRDRDQGSEDAPPPETIVRYPTSRDDLPKPPARRNGARRAIPVLRPPGAVDEPTFLRDCTRCDACLEACPHDAIIHAPQRFREAAGTPMIDPMREPCRMCEDFPCIEACEPDVLTSLVPPVMGTARIQRQTCIAHQNGFCSACWEQCPVEGAISVENGKPTVVEETCTGCGVCQHVCPAPTNAVLLMPAFSRPGTPPDDREDAGA